MPSKRLPVTFSELEPKGRGAILRSVEEVQAEEALLLDQDTGTLQTEEPVSPNSPQRSLQAKIAAEPRSRRKPASRPNVTSLASQNYSPQASALAIYPASIIETIRKIVKVQGKDVSFVRLTPEEKGQLADIVYTYKRLGKKTTENEINRIAVNFMLEDYKANGNNSILACVIDALLA